MSAAGITSGLAAAGAIVGGGMVAGVFVLAAPVAALAAGGVGVAAHLKSKQLRQESARKELTPPIPAPKAPVSTSGIALCRIVLVLSFTATAASFRTLTTCCRESTL